MKKWFDKNEEIHSNSFSIPKSGKNEELKKFYLHIENLIVGELAFTNNKWRFKYSDEFKLNTNEFNLIIGFPDVNKVYYSQELWPFFKIRIPGLKQPMIREILKKENIEENNHFKLLERFGKRTISNPYELDIA